MSTNMNRRAILAGAVISAVPVPVLAAAPDPIFAAIERHHIAWAAYARELDLNEDWERPAVRAASEAVDNAAVALLDAAPTTLAGVTALLRYSVEFEERWDCWPEGLCDDTDADKPPDEPSAIEMLPFERKGRWHLWLQRHAANALEHVALR